MQHQRYFLLLLVIIVLGIFGFYFKMKDNTPVSKNSIRYVALGDSYTSGEGTTPEYSWPVVLTAHLQKQGIPLELIANPSVTGWTTQQVIDNELSVYDASRPTFATLLIGVNDWVQGVDALSFQKNLQKILDHMQQILPNKKNIVLITIPDFSVTPAGARYGRGRDIGEGVTEFNTIIKQEAEKRNLLIVDIFPLSQQAKNKPELIATDGLHPSAKQYAKWEELIFPVVNSVLK
ncbi:SGNH/GDSL hydrolase family protein [soil metagenome]